MEEHRKPVQFRHRNSHSYRPIHGSRATIDEQIDAVFSDPDNFEEGEVRPTEKAISSLKQLLADASDAFGASLPRGDIAPYFGEISITWRRANRMLRLTAFSDASAPRLDFGTTPEGSLGDYTAVPNASGQQLADRLNWLLTAPATT